MNNKSLFRSDKISIGDILSKIRGKKIILFGAASSGKKALFTFLESGIEKKNISFYDNNSKKWGKKIFDIEVLSLDKFIKLPKEIPIFISSLLFVEIAEQLKELGFTNFCFVSELMYPRRLMLKYDHSFLDLLDKVEGVCTQDNDEIFTLFSSMKAVRNLDGEVAEVGVYKGGSAKILCETKGSKALHLCDTFEGLPGTQEEDLVKKGWLNDVSLKEVKNYLSAYNNVYFYKGIFSNTTPPSVTRKKILFGSS